MLKNLKDFALNKEPVAVFAVFGTSVLGFVTEAQGNLHGVHAWVAVGVAGAAWALRHFVSPAAKLAEAEEVSEDAESLADRLDRLENVVHGLSFEDDEEEL